jgi:hypothetical protein
MPRGASYWSLIVAWWRGYRYEKAMERAAVRARDNARAPPSRRDEVGEVSVPFAELYAHFFEPEYGPVSVPA